MVAATEGFDNVVKSLVEHSCNPDIKNSFGIAPIHYLSMKNHWRGELSASNKMSVFLRVKNVLKCRCCDVYLKKKLSAHLVFTGLEMTEHNIHLGL